ncbi:MAG: flagellar biosynthesis protein FlhB [Eubacteriales bacterium]|nr:flagellar biosynthesis protein FlhB [Eubacteriales bacterium]
MSQKPSSGEKTEKATPRRRREAKEKGQVFKSREVITALSLMAMFGALSVFGRGIIENIELMLQYFFAEQDVTGELTVSAVSTVFSNAVILLLTILVPVLIAAFLCGLVFNVLQTGFVFSSKAMAPKMERISMVSGFKRIFSKRTLIELLKSLIKVAILGMVAYSEYERHMNEFSALMTEDIETSVAAFVEILFNTAFKLSLALAIFAPFDYIYQRWKYGKDLMMTKQEIRDEYKLTEGNPQIKGKIAQKQRQISRMRMVQAVKNADVVITNPTHYAIALTYKEGKQRAPLVVAKGKDYLAQTIKEKAKEWQIEIVENKTLAQSLYFFCEVGDEVPEELYKAVAEVLAYVYRLKKTRGFNR